MAWIDFNLHNKYMRRKVQGLTNSRGVNEEDLLESFYRRQLTEMAMSRYSWSGIPNNIPVDFVEKILFQYGMILFYKHKFGMFEMARATAVGPVNIYDNANRYQPFSNAMGYRTPRQYSESDVLTQCVPIWANYSRMPDIDIVSIYARRLARLDRTIDINVANARQPRLYTGSANTALSVKNIHNQIDGGADFLFITREMADEITALDTGIDPDTFDKLHVLRARLFNECMGLLGIDNANQEKKERLVSGEVDANEEQVDVSRAKSMNTRQQACDRINRVFGLNLQVEYVGKSDSLDMLAGKPEELGM